MSYLETSALKNSTTMLIFAERHEIKLDPDYQRMGDIWPLEKRQLLIDSILNDYDIPKIYFHVFDRTQKAETGYTYSVIDGRQRLETIWRFIEGKFNLSNTFEYQKDPNIKLNGLGYEDIAKEYPRIRIQFDSFVLPIVGITTDDEDLIEDMFSRLNEAVPLNASEKRNAFGGNAVRIIRDISNHDFFTKKIKFSNKRYQYLEVSARILLIEDSIRRTNKLIDTKKVYLDKFAKDNVNKAVEMDTLAFFVKEILNEMVQLFTDSDELLRSQGNIAVYYLLFRKAKELQELHKLSRRTLLDFREELYNNRKIAEAGDTNYSFDLLEYDRLSQQGTNDASNIRERFRILSEAMHLSNVEVL